MLLYNKLTDESKLFLLKPRFCVLKILISFFLDKTDFDKRHLNKYLPKLIIAFLFIHLLTYLRNPKNMIDKFISIPIKLTTS